MKTPTLIVRLVGLYLMVNASLTLIQLRSVESMGPIGAAQQSTLGNIRIYAVLGLLIGIAGTLFAGPLARLLTFDAKPRMTQAEVTEKLLQRKG